MNFATLYFDELTGFFRARVMHVLLIGLPVLTVVLRLIQPETEGIPLMYFVAILIASIGGTLSAVLLATSVTSERNRGVYDLFLIRPVSRNVLLLAKYFAALTTLLAAVILCLVLGISIDAIAGNFRAAMIRESAESLVLSLAGMATACAVGLLFGTLFDSVAVSAILAVYLGNQLSAIVILPTIFIERLEPMLFAPIVGITLPALILAITLRVFARKSL